MGDEYTVGYGKPPKHSQFKPGHSGNPKGRPKAAKNLKTELAEELLEIVAIKESGKTKKISKQRAVLKSLMAKAVQGDVRAIGMLINVFLKVDPETKPSADEEMSETDEQILQEFLAKQVARQRGKSNGEGE